MTPPSPPRPAPPAPERRPGPDAVHGRPPARVRRANRTASARGHPARICPVPPPIPVPLMSSRRPPRHEAGLEAHPSDLATLAAHIAEDEAAIYGRLPDRDLVAAFADGVVSLLFPDGRDAPRTPAGIHAELEARCRALVPVLAPLKDKLPASPEELAHAFHVEPAGHPRAADARRRGDRGRRPGGPRHRRGGPRLPRVPGARLLPHRPRPPPGGDPPRPADDLGDRPRPDRRRHPPGGPHRPRLLHRPRHRSRHRRDRGHRRRRQALPGRHAGRPVGQQGRRPGPSATPPSRTGSSSTPTRRCSAATPSSAPTPSSAATSG